MKMLLILLLLMLVGCTTLIDEPKELISNVSNTEYEDLIKRIGELEEEVGNMNDRLYEAVEEWRAYTGNEEITQEFNSWLVVVHPDIHEYYSKEGH